MNKDAIRQEIREKTRFTFSRSGGPGGQNVNKRDTKATARLALVNLESLDEKSRNRLYRKLGTRLTGDGELVVQASEERSQSMNKERALMRIEALVMAALRPDPKPRRATKPSRAARERRLESKKHRGTVKAGRRKPISRDD